MRAQAEEQFIARCGDHGGPRDYNPKAERRFHFMLPTCYDRTHFSLRLFCQNWSCFIKTVYRHSVTVNPRQFALFINGRLGQEAADAAQLSQSLSHRGPRERADHTAALPTTPTSTQTAHFSQMCAHTPRGGWYFQHQPFSCESPLSLAIKVHKTQQALHLRY